jgi:hypothetical protein
MSGRSGYRKTARPLVVVRNAPPVAPDLPPDPPSPEYPVRLTFRLPDSILTSPGPHGFNTNVLPGNLRQTRGVGCDRVEAVKLHDAPAGGPRSGIVALLKRTQGRHEFDPFRPAAPQRRAVLEQREPSKDVVGAGPAIGCRPKTSRSTSGRCAKKSVAG